MLRHDRVVPIGRKKPVDGAAHGACELYDERVIVGRGNRHDIVVAVARGNRVVRIDDRAIRKNAVACREPNAILPMHVATKMIDNAKSVGGDTSVCERRHRACDVGNRLAVWPVGQEVGEDQTSDHEVGRAFKEQRVERLRLRGDGDDEVIARSRRGSLDASGKKRRGEKRSENAGYNPPDAHSASYAATAISPSSSPTV